MTNRTSFLCSRRIGGFTLIELMITVVVLAIIVGIAVPSYTQQIRKSRRTDARNALLDIAGREERWLSVSNSYSAVPTDVGYPGAAWLPPVNLPDGYYTVSVTTPDAANQPGVANSFIITATAIGQQASDTDCATFTVNQQGVQTAATAAAVANTTTCWGN
jgi:type IV pilus assembly protein PilE